MKIILLTLIFMSSLYSFSKIESVDVGFKSFHFGDADTKYTREYEEQNGKKYEMNETNLGLFFNFEKFASSKFSPSLGYIHKNSFNSTTVSFKLNRQINRYLTVSIGANTGYEKALGYKLIPFFGFELKYKYIKTILMPIYSGSGDMSAVIYTGLTFKL